MVDPFIGVIVPWPIAFAPQGWLYCQGQELPVNQYTALYSLLGNIYGGRTNQTFCLPNLCGRTIVGCGLRPGGNNINYTLALARGNEYTVATLDNLPTHTHNAKNVVTGESGTATFTIPAKNANGNTNTPSATTYLAIAKDSASRPSAIYNNDATVNPTINMPGGTITVPQPNITTTIDPTGAGNPMVTISPFIALNYIIAVEGIYPVRPD